MIKKIIGGISSFFGTLFKNVVSSPFKGKDDSKNNTQSSNK